MFYWKRGPEPGRMGASITIMSILSDRLSEEILQARQRVYTVGEPTPLQRLNLPGIKAPVYAKREDLGPIRAYKWRGAFNCMAALSQEARDKGIVAASAGNHAQGVALAASVLNCHATIFMPRSTPEVKQTEVRRHGGRHVKIMLHGDCYDETAAAAHEYAETHGSTFVHPYDDLVTMAGQGTLADEVVMSGEGPFDRAYVAIGGGGLAAGVSTLAKLLNPNVKVIGVEPTGAASMKASLEAGHVVSLPTANTIADGTAVKTPGDKVFPYIRDHVDQIITIPDTELVEAFLDVMEKHKMVVENSGLLSVAALRHLSCQGLNVVCVLSGGNMDVITMASLVQHGLIMRGRIFTFSVLLPDRPGALLSIADILARENGNVIKLEHNQFVNINRQSGVELKVTLEAFGHDHKDRILEALSQAGYQAHEVDTTDFYH